MNEMKRSALLQYIEHLKALVNTHDAENNNSVVQAGGLRDALGYDGDITIDSKAKAEMLRSLNIVISTPNTANIAKLKNTLNSIPNVTLSTIPSGYNADDGKPFLDILSNLKKVDVLQTELLNAQKTNDEARKKLAETFQNIASDKNFIVKSASLVMGAVTVTSLIVMGLTALAKVLEQGAKANTNALGASDAVDAWTQNDKIAMAIVTILATAAIVVAGAYLAQHFINNKKKGKEDKAAGEEIAKARVDIGNMDDMSQEALTTKISVLTTDTTAKTQATQPLQVRARENDSSPSH